VIGQPDAVRALGKGVILHVAAAHQEDDRLPLPPTGDLEGGSEIRAQVDMLTPAFDEALRKDRGKETLDGAVVEKRRRLGGV
jgi:hypothetical protein